MRSKRHPLGQLLVKRRFLSPKRLGEALVTQQGTSRRLASELLKRGIVSEVDLLRCLSDQVGIPGVSLSRLVLPLRFLDVLAEADARRHQVLPVWVDQDHVFLASADPLGPDFEDQVAFLVQKRVVSCVALATPLLELIERAYESKAKGELELRGSAAETIPMGELELIHSEDLGYVPAMILPDGSPSGLHRAVSLEESSRREKDSDIEIDLSGETNDEDIAVEGSSSFADVLTAEPQDEQGAHLRALVVDDDVDLTRVIERLFRAHGLRVQLAHRGLAALAAIKAQPPDLLVLDAMLPELHGFDIVKKIKHSERYRHVPVVMMSSVYRGWRIAEDLKESYGVEAFIEKPFSLDGLWRIVDRVLHVAKQRDRHRHRLPPSAHQAYRESVALFRGQDIDGAIAALKKGLGVDPLSAKLHFQLGVLFLKKRGMIYQAIQAFEEAVQLEPDFFAALRSLAILYQRKGFKNKAVEMWERALRTSPDEETAGQMRQHLLNLL